MTTRIKPLVMKFGGTSVEDAPAMTRAADIVSARKHLRPVVVVSAMSKVTDALLAAFARAAAGDAGGALAALAPHFARHLDAAQGLVAAGEVEGFAAVVREARSELAALLREAAGGARPHALLQDAVVS
ncbi:MAG: lysine-sensitive aspartokinase 3, partial [Acidobacteria bacterium]|nr:lysine-sensitive aspartokinase 3 [Acidobacteriota bacterium]